VILRLKQGTFGLRRLWNYLVREDSVQNLFIRFVFGRKRAEDTLSLWEGNSVTIDGTGRVKGGKEEKDEESEDDGSVLGPVRIVHKEHESISAFCINQVRTLSQAIYL